MPSSDPIAPGETHLHIVDDADIPEPALGKYQAVMSADERQRCDRFHFERDRRQFTVTRGLLRFTLTRYWRAIEPENWRFARNAHGRPAIENDIGCRLDFNLSHTTGRAVLVVSRLPAVGVDMEWCGRSLDAADLAKRFFAADETAALPSDAAALERQFFELWTLKEAYVKALGKGLSIPLDSFSIGFPGETGLSLRVEDPAQEHIGWRLWSLDAGQGHALAVAAMADQTATLRLFRVVPAVFVQEIDPRILRSL